jgi:preprotein translocase subunit SecE
MGRILRKKTTSLKKKKKQEPERLFGNSADSPEAVSGKSAESQGPVTAVAENRRPAIVPRKFPAAPAPVPASPQSDTVFTRAVQFLREVKTELKKVTWPTRKQAMGSTLVVIVLVMIISLFLGIVDMGLSTLVRAVFN